nr:transglycosylase domain-containing protein [Thermobifida alba]
MTRDDVNGNESGSEDDADRVAEDGDATEDKGEPEWFASDGDSPYLEASAFKDSGSFFRDRVARSLAEEYGLDFDENGGKGTDPVNADGGDEQRSDDQDGPAGTTPPAEDTDQEAESSGSVDEEETERIGSGSGSVDEEETERIGSGSGSVDEEETERIGSGSGSVDEEETERIGSGSGSVDEEETERIGSGSGSVDEEETERIGSGSGSVDEEETERIGSGSGSVDEEETERIGSGSGSVDEEETERIGSGSGSVDEEETERIGSGSGSVDEEETERIGSGSGSVDEEETERIGSGSGSVDEEETERIQPSAPAAGQSSGLDEATIQVPAVGAAPEQPAPPSAPTSETTAVFSHNPADPGSRRRPLPPRFMKSAGRTGDSGPATPPPPTTTAAGGAGPDGKGKNKKGKPKRKKPLWWRITRVGLIAAVLLVGLVAGGFAYAYTAFEVPDAAQADATAQGSVFYYADGSVLTERGVNRKPVSLDSVPEHVQNAILSAENRGFWDEPGVSLTGTARAVWSTVTGKQVQGGSTITQQFVRNYYEGLSQEQTIERKLKEIIIALKVDRSQPKEWILEQYLNTIYFGRNAYGIQAAAEAYYDKNVGDLTPDEAAFLAAAIQQPTKFGFADSDTTPEMENRWEYVVNGLVDMGSITEAEAAEYEFPKPLPERPQDNIDLSGYKGYMFQQAMKELEELGYSEDNINRGGYEIHTTFDPDLMEAAYEAVQETVPVDDLPEGVRVGLSVVDPSTGGVVAFYGGQDYFENQYDSAFLGTAQAGSAMKPYVLAAALKDGLGLYTVVNGNGPRYINGTMIQNAGNAPGGAMNLIQATTVSNNLGYIDLAERVGLEKVAETAYDMGLPEGSIDLVPVLPLGANSVSPTDQAGGYATFANGGEHIETHVVSSIINKEGEEERPEPERKRVLTEEQAADATYAMRQVINSGTGTAAGIGRPAAGKTGTTNGSVAAWFVGYTPQLSAAVGIYSGDNERFSVPGWGTLSGGTLPATVWRTFMQKALEGEPVKDFPSPTFGGSSPNWAPAPEPEETTTDESTSEESAPENGQPAVPAPEVPQPVVPEPVVPEPVVPEPEVPQPGIPPPGDPGSGTTEGWSPTG